MADLSVLAPLAIWVGVAIVVLLGLAALFKAFYYKVEQGTARSRGSEQIDTFPAVGAQGKAQVQT